MWSSAETSGAGAKGAARGAHHVNPPSLLPCQAVRSGSIGKLRWITDKAAPSSSRRGGRRGEPRFLARGLRLRRVLACAGPRAVRVVPIHTCARGAGGRRGVRVCADYRPPNAAERVTQHNLPSAASIASWGTYATRVNQTDLAAAYQQQPLRRRWHANAAVVVKGVVLVIKGLSFGLLSAPAAQQRLAEAIVAIQHRHGRGADMYVDDAVGEYVHDVQRWRECCVRAQQPQLDSNFFNLFLSLGCALAVPKCVSAEPRPIVLGLLLDYPRGRMFLSERRVEKLR
eukprot:gene2561-5409_t